MASRQTAVGLFVIAIAVSLFAVLAWRAPETAMSAGFWYEPNAFRLSPNLTRRLGGPLNAGEIDTIVQRSRRELESAYSGLRIAIGEDRGAFWRIQVVQTVQGRSPMPRAGQTIGLGPLGGLAQLGFAVLAATAMRHAAPDASRQSIVEAIGRGAGRAAVHELAHQILGTVEMDNTSDDQSYEFHSFDRPAQYFGELRWSSAWPLLAAKVGP
jgi:hypothetical protein